MTETRRPLHVQVHQLVLFFEQCMLIAELWQQLTEELHECENVLAVLESEDAIRTYTNRYLDIEKRMADTKREQVRGLRSSYKYMKKIWVPDERVYNILDWCLPQDINPLRDEEAWRIWTATQ